MHRTTASSAFWPLRVSPSLPTQPLGLMYQTEGTQHGQPLHVGQAQLHQAECDNEAVEDVPALLEILIGVQGDQLQHHLCSENAREDLGGWVTQNPCHRVSRRKGSWEISPRMRVEGPEER